MAKLFLTLLAQLDVETTPLPLLGQHFWHCRQFSVRRSACLLARKPSPATGTSSPPSQLKCSSEGVIWICRASFTKWQLLFTLSSLSPWWQLEDSVNNVGKFRFGLKLIRFPTLVSSELLLELVLLARRTPGLLTIYLVGCSVLSLMVTLHRSQKSPLVSHKDQYTRTTIILQLYWPAELHPTVCHIQNPTLCRWHLTSQAHQEDRLHFRCRQPSKRHQLSYSMGKTLRFVFKHPKD